MDPSASTSGTPDATGPEILVFSRAATSHPSRGELARRLSGAPHDTRSLDRIAALAARLLGASSGQIALLSDEQLVIGGAGASAGAVGRRSPAEESVCSLTVEADAEVVITDAANDDRAEHFPVVRAGTVAAYVGVPLRIDGEPVGALCVYAEEPRTWSSEDVHVLEELVAPVVAELQLAALTQEYESERLVWQLAVDAAGVGAFDWDLVTGELRWDSRLLDLFGLDRTTFGGTIDAFNDALHPDDLDRVTRALTEAIDTIGLYAAEYRVVLPDGTIRWIAARGRALAGPDGRAARVLGAAYDTTAVQDGEARVARVLEAMPTAFFHLDPAWRFTYVNERGRELLGPVRGELIGANVWELFPASVGTEVEAHYRRAVDSGEPVEFEVSYPPPLDRSYEVRAWPTPDGLSVYFIDVTERREAEQREAQAAARQHVLTRLSEDLTRTLDAQQAATQLAEAVAGTWGDWCLVTLADRPIADPAVRTPAAAPWRRGLTDVAGAHVDPALRPVVDAYRRLRIDALTDASFLARALTTQDTVIIEDGATEAIDAVLGTGDARELWRRLAPRSAVLLPLRGRDHTVGALSVFRDAGSEPFSPEDVADLVDAASRAGLALDNARLYSEQRDLAEGLQRSLLTAPPEPDHLHVVVRYEPAAQAAQVGGDWYDAFLQPGGATSVVIGDVIGHDTAAAAAMGQLRGLLRGIAVAFDESPATVLSRVDRAMKTLMIDTTATAVVARFEQTAQERRDGVTRFRWSNAGHPPPLVAVPADGYGATVEVVALSPDDPGAPYELLLGLDPEAERTDSVVTLPRGVTVLLYTDGLVERRGRLIDEGVAQLREVVAELVGAELTLDELCDELLRRMLPESNEDDVAIVAVRLHPEDRPRPPEAGPRRVPGPLPAPLPPRG
ncbi:SpoIIE family protein phosphatase [Nocardioides flavescens]|uniref:SpoIIE family protein phosphatase n=1 Tax=Nocardioides flavescens TaxID=2691959 RepID=A0A6L7EW77_9ACTN|nr:SpoIIE family protein phosphatase [Nocardioides flavescens]MXG90026.1 SpoIIE family protein phosphatase [Nocardioides flavescens]